MISKTHDDLSETHIQGARTRFFVVRADQSDRRAWMSDAPVCRALLLHRIAHAGVATAREPYEVVRMKQSGAYFIGCLAGEGRILVDGRWQDCRPGMGCLLPPGILNAFHCIPGKSWEFVWVRYQPEPEVRRMVTASSPVMAKFDGTALKEAVLGLHAESSGDAQPAAAHLWVELIHGYVLRFTRPWQMDARLSRLWEMVSGRLNESWTISSLSREAHMSGEHLRRMCVRELGRSPLRQLTFLRMRHAADMLSSTDEKVESVARAAGYKNAFVFSTTFKKWIGWRPSKHRHGKTRG